MQAQAGEQLRNLRQACQINKIFFKKKGPDPCGSVGRELSHKARGPQFNSKSGHVPELWIQVPSEGGKLEATNQHFSLTSAFLTLSFSLPFPRPKNK